VESNREPDMPEDRPRGRKNEHGTENADTEIDDRAWEASASRRECEVYRKKKTERNEIDVARNGRCIRNYPSA